MSAVETVERYGADTARTYVCFMGPPERGGDWVDEGVEGVHRFLVRLWRLAERGRRAHRAPTRRATGGRELDGPARELLAKTHWAIDKVTRDIEHGFQFHTAIAAVMELVNDAYRLKDELYGDAGGRGGAALRHRDRRLADLPLRPAPRRRGLRARSPASASGSSPGREADPALLERDTFTLVVQVNGKRRDQIEAAAGASEDELLELARASENVRRHLDGKRGRQGDRRPRQARQPRRALSAAHVHTGRAAGLLESARAGQAPLRGGRDEVHRLRPHILMDAGELGSRNLSVNWLEVPAGRLRGAALPRGGRAGLRRRQRHRDDDRHRRHPARSSPATWC